MKKRELERFKKKLLKKKQMLLEELKHIEKDALIKSQRDASGDLSGYTYHMADVATDTYNRDFSLELATSGQRVLFEIDEALRRIKEKTYGNCEVCGGKIGKERLEAVPHARLCIDCQEKEESKKMR